MCNEYRVRARRLYRRGRRGALIALIVVSRQQKIAEDGTVHDRTQVFNERFTAIAALLGDAQPAVRLADVYAMAGLGRRLDRVPRQSPGIPRQDHCGHCLLPEPVTRIADRAC